MNEFIKYVEENIEEAEKVFNEWYIEKAQEEGDWMREDDRFYGEMESEDFYMEDEEIYEDFAYATGYSASYHGAYGVITKMGHDFDVDVDDESLQVKIIELFERDY